MYSFEVHSNENTCGKSGLLGLEQVSRSSESSICKDTRSPVDHYHKVFYYITIQLYINQNNTHKTSIIQSILQAQPNIFPHYVSIHKHTLRLH